MSKSTGFTEIVGLTPWDEAIKAVDFPVRILPLFFEDTKADKTISMELATGDTNTGRDTQFYGVAVDRYRTGSTQIIATVTGTYGTLDNKVVYQDLRDDLKEAGLTTAKPVRSYVSGNGGRAILTVAVPSSEVKIGDDKVCMHLNLDTSVDGSKKHTMRLAVFDEDGVEIVGMGEKTFTIGAKHTTTIGTRHASFQTVLVKLAAEWQTTIAPMLSFMADVTFDRGMAIDIFKEIMSNADLPERHIKNAVESYVPKQNENMFGVLRGISVYLSETLSEKPERLEEFREKINKKSRALIQQTINSFKKETK